MFLKPILGSGVSTGLSARALFTVTVDSRPWWHSMHRFASTGFRLPSASFSVLKVSETPEGNGTFTTARRSGKLAGSWQVVQAKPFEIGWATRPVYWTPVLVTSSVPLLA